MHLETEQTPCTKLKVDQQEKTKKTVELQQTTISIKCVVKIYKGIIACSLKPEMYVPRAMITLPLTTLQFCLLAAINNIQAWQMF